MIRARALHPALAACAAFALASAPACQSAAKKHDAGESGAVAPVVPEEAAPALVTIEVRLKTLDPSRGGGPIQIALWNSESNFMRSGNWLRGATVPIAECDKPVLFTDLPPGTYAVSAFHDTQSAGTLRRGTFGIPIDPWAVSNGGSPLLPPSWRRAKFTVTEGTAIISLDFHAGPEGTP